MERAIAIATLANLMALTALAAFTLWRMILVTNEARAARRKAEAASTAAELAATRAAAASQEAADHARTNAAAMLGIAAEMKELKVNTNHIQEALNVANLALGEATGEKRGIAIGEARRDPGT